MSGKRASDSKKVTRRTVALLMAGGTLTMLGECMGPLSASYRARMTVEVNTAQGIKTGSSVLEVRASSGLAIGDSSGVSAILYGEAVVVELPDGPLFVLLTLPEAGAPLAQVFGEALLGKPINTPDAVMSSTATLGSTWLGSYKADLPRRRDIGATLREHGRDDSNWPVMVRFRDLRDPRSVELVKPEEVGVIRISLRTTRAAQSAGIANVLPWLAQHPRFFIEERDASGGLLPPSKITIAHTLHLRDFSTTLDRL